MISLSHSYNFRRKKKSRLAREYREWDLNEIASAYTFLVRISIKNSAISFSKRVVSLLALFMWDSYMLELEKKRCYEERIREIEHGSFTPLVLSAAGGIGPAATIVYKRLASLISEKQGRPYSSTLHWVRCRLNFSLLRSAVMCIRGSRSTFASEPNTVSSDSIDLAVHEGQVQSF